MDKNIALQFADDLVRDYKYKKIPLLLAVQAHDIYSQNLPDWIHPIGANVYLYSSSGTPIATGYTRIVIGDYGAFIEISQSQIIKANIKVENGQEYRMYDEQYRDHVKYFWLTAKDDSHCKIYFQQKEVEYADYKPGYYYISPYEVKIVP